MQALWATMGLVRPRAKTIAPIIAFIEIFTAMVNLQIDSFSRCCLLLHAVVVIGVRRSTEDDECSPIVPTDASCARGDPLYWSRHRLTDSRTRSTIMLRSNSANTPIIWNMALPAGVVVSIPC